MGKKIVSNSWLIYFPVALFALDWLLLFIATKLDGQFNNGNFFDNIHAWRWGVLGLPLAIAGIVYGLIGAKRAKGLTKIVPLVGLILCILLSYWLYWSIVNANHANYWGV
ncbi:MAG TPA: hypothetical protein VIH90_00655 [Candidatus Saccharimonadales bacterium]